MDARSLLKTSKSRLISMLCTCSLASIAFSGSAFAVPVIYQGLDIGATSLATGPNAQAASDAFDLATGPLNIIDFDTNTTGATLSPASAPQACGFALCGGNTTLGGSGFFGHVFTTTITFDSAIDSFGAYFSGWQRATQTLEYTDGTTVTLNMPSGDLQQGGLLFFGFTDIGASISSITYDTVLGDFVGIDDMRFGIASVPEPNILALMGLGLAVFGFCRKRKAA